MTPTSAEPDTLEAGEAALDRDEPDHGDSDPETVDEFDDPDGAGIAVAASPPGLDERSRQILAFERRWWRYAGAKEQAIRDTFGLSSTRYYQLLNALLDEPAALAHDPLLIGRLRRLRASRNRPRPR